MPHKKGKAVACVQPRKIMAAIQAHRVAQELEGTRRVLASDSVHMRKINSLPIVPVGEHVGYATVSENRTTRQTMLVYLTDEALVREMLSDRYLSRYSVIILDDVHERDAAVCLRDVLEARVVVELAVELRLDVGDERVHLDGGRRRGDVV